MGVAMVEGQAGECSTPWCRNPPTKRIGEYDFCTSCRRSDSEKVLVTQADFSKPVKDLLVDLVQTYPKADALAGALGVSQVTLYAWVRTFFGGMKFDDFRRTHLCRYKKCLILSTQGMQPSEKYYAIGKVRQRGICSCPVGRESSRSLILANCSVSRLQEVFPDLDKPGRRSAPQVLGSKVHDDED